jgi:hypothetical protein
MPSEDKSEGFLLAAIEARDYSIVRLQHAKDMFVFSCYTGLANIDTFNLTPQNLGIGIDGGYWITTCRKKTDQPVRIPLLPKAMVIKGIMKRMFRNFHALSL